MARGEVTEKDDAALFTEVLGRATEALEHKESRVRHAAATTLGRMGQAARPAVPALLEALQDKDEDVRRQAAAAVQAIDPEAAKKAGIR